MLLYGYRTVIGSVAVTGFAKFVTALTGALVVSVVLTVTLSCPVAEYWPAYAVTFSVPGTALIMLIAPFVTVATS